jgi:hypothetical protein
MPPLQAGLDELLGSLPAWTRAEADLSANDAGAIGRARDVLTEYGITSSRADGKLRITLSGPMLPTLRGALARLEATGIGDTGWRLVRLWGPDADQLERWRERRGLPAYFAPQADFDGSYALQVA